MIIPGIVAAAANANIITFDLLSKDAAQLSLPSTQDTIWMDPDGDFFMTHTANLVYTWELSTNGDITSGSQLNSYDTFSNDSLNTLRGIAVRDDGGFGFVSSQSADIMQGYGMSTSWHANTMSPLASFDYTPNSGVDVKDIFVSPDGLHCYILTNGNSLHEYSFSTAWGGTFTFIRAKSNLTDIGTPAFFTFNSTGTELYINFQALSLIRKYNLSTAWNISTATLDSSAYDFSSGGVLGRIHVSYSDTKLFTKDLTNDFLEQYTIL